MGNTADISILYVYIIFSITLVFKNWIPTFKFNELISILFHKPTINRFPVSILTEYIQPIILQNNFNHILFITSIGLSIFYLYKSRHLHTIPFFIVMYMFIDLLTPLLLSLYHMVRLRYRFDIVLLFILFIHEPLFVTPFLIDRILVKRKIEYKAFAVLFLVSFYAFFKVVVYGFVLDEYLLISTMILSLYSLLVYGFKGLTTFLAFVSPYSVSNPILYSPNTIEDDSKKTFRKILILVILISGNIFIFSTQNVNATFNTSIDQFLVKTLKDSNTVLSLSHDDYINSFLLENGYYVVGYSYSYFWNWSDRDEIRKLLSDALEYAENHGIKYILIDKPRELSYWISNIHYKEYKYPLREPLDRYIVVLERKGFVETSKNGFYIEDVGYNKSVSLTSNFVKYWSNISVDLDVKDMFISINSSKPYETYIHFNSSSSPTNLLIKLEGDDDYIRSLEIYGYDGKLKSVWETSFKRIYNPVVVELNLSFYQEFVVKIEDNSSNRLYIYKLDKKELYEVDSSRTVTLLSNLSPIEMTLGVFFSDIKINVKPYSIAEIDDSSYNIILLLTLLTSVLNIIILYNWNRPDFPIFHEEREIIELDRIPIYLIFYSIPLILYLNYPRMLEISWIGAGVFLLAYSMALFNIFIEERSVKKSLDRNAIVFIFLYVSTSYLLKIWFGWIFDVRNDFWRNQSLFVSYDVISFGLYATLFSIFSFGLKRPSFYIPGVYLFLNGFIFLTDLFRIKNVLYKSLIDLATVLVDYSMELLSYRLEYVSVPAGNALYIYQDKLLTIVILGWPCAGVTGLFLYISFTMVINHYFKNRFGKGISNKLITAGLIITYLLNIIRIDVILLLDIYYGVNASELFHSIGYEAIFLLWIIIFLMISRKNVLSKDFQYDIHTIEEYK